MFRFLPILEIQLGIRITVEDEMARTNYQSRRTGTTRADEVGPCYLLST